MTASKSGILFLFSFMSWGISVSGQSLSLEECYQAAELLSPVNQQKLYYQSMAQLKDNNAKISSYPQLQLYGQATYQSDVFSLPFSNPAEETPTIPNDQYQLALRLNQKIYDGGVTGLTRDLAANEAKVNQQQVTVALYQIREVINRLFFGALISQENEKILDATRVLLIHQLDEVESKVSNGVILASNANILKKEILSTEQQLIAVAKEKEVLLQMLGEWIGKKVPQTVMLAIPEVENIEREKIDIHRPEMDLFDLQSQQTSISRSLAAKKDYPKLSAFIVGGIAQPNPYNFFKTDVSDYYMGGITLNWNLFNWGSNKNDIKILDIQSKIITTKKDDFERQLTISLMKEQSDIQKLDSIIEKDKEILVLQDEIVKEAYAQLKNGLITSTQYITEVNNQTRARLNNRIHVLDLIQTKVNLLVKSGNF